ncbi:MAG TPA: carboxypeptidase-like regulatory domain-containing protein, partial [Blastocatellia bacterium]
MLKSFCLLGALILGVSPVLAQVRSSSADLTGVVYDPAKLPLRGAIVTATNVATGLARAAMTDASGVYRIPVLQPGIYEVRIEVSGFATQAKKGVMLTV